MKLIYSVEALSDLVRLRAFIEDNDPSAASRVARELITRIDKLKRFPRLGVPVAKAPDPETVRDLVAGNYIVRYSVHPKAIVVLRIWHHFEEWK
jgi:toxin ParE1/3/4